MSDLLSAVDLVIEYGSAGRRQRALDGATLTVRDAEFVGLVGESGSGKSTLGLAVGRLLPPNGHRRGGDLSIDGRSVFDMPTSEVRALRRHQLGFIFQDPIGSLDPTMRVGRQVALASADAGQLQSPASQLARVGLGETVALSYPHELSGGMAQRAAFLIALTRHPRLIVADEPTASLDSTIRRQMLDLLFDLARESGSAVLLLTHDLRSVEQYCTRVAVMYGGRVVEDGPTVPVLRDPVHPYTQALLASAVGREDVGGRVIPIAGTPPVLHDAAVGCAFAARCNLVIERCRVERPSPQLVDGRVTLCHRAAERHAGHSTPVQVGRDE